MAASNPRTVHMESDAKSPAPRVLALITARGGSKGLPGKNLRLLAGRPLIAWSIQAALEATTVERVVVSTDAQDIADAARHWGAQVPFMRPAELAGDTSPHMDVILHALSWLATHQDYHPDYLLLLQPTSPLRTAADIDTAVALLLERGAGSLVSVREARDHPYLVKSLDDRGEMREFIPIPDGYLRRQDLPPAYALNGALYLARTDSLLRDRTFSGPGTLAYVMPVERSLDIDSAWDLALAQWFMDQTEGATRIASHDAFNGGTDGRPDAP